MKASTDPGRFRRGGRTALLLTAALIVVVGGVAMIAGERVVFATAVAQSEPVDLELVLAVDTSASVDAKEYRLQMEGLVQAFRDPEIIAAIRTTGARGIAATVVHWSSAHQQKQIVPWTRIYNETSAYSFSAAISRHPQRDYADSTGIGGVMEYGERLIRRNQFEGRRKSIDVSADGVNNSGAQPEFVRDKVVAEGITINGLAILSDNPFLFKYFDEVVIGGPSAFVLTVASYNDIIEGTRNKLLREISVAVAHGPERNPGTKFSKR